MTRLLDHHTAQLDASAISATIRRERGYWSATNHHEWAKRDGDMADYQRKLPGLAYPIYRLAASKPYTMMLRPDEPRIVKRDDGKERLIKYEHPAGLPPIIDMLPRFRDSLRDTAMPLWFTEGAKKADALASLGQSLVPASLNDVWCWKRRTADGESKPLADFDELALKGRIVVLAFDSDQAVNEHVQKALAAFTAFLVSRGATVGNLRLPHGAQKLGVDDAIAAGWTYEQLVAAIEWSTPPVATRPCLLHASQLDAIPETVWLIDGVLAMNKLSQTFAPPGSGKSFLELDKALNVAQKYPVVYVAAEAVEDYRDRVAAWCEYHHKEPGTIYFWSEPIMLKDDASVESFLNEISAIGPAAIFIDPLASCMVGLEESSTGDMTIAVEALNRIRRATGAAMHIVHHTGWNDAHERGSSVLRAACRIVMKLSLDDSGLMSLTCEKANNGKPFDVRHFRLVASGTSAVPVPASKIDTRDAPVSEKQFQVMEALDLRHFRDGATHTQIVEHTTIGKSTVNKALDRLIARGYVAFEGERNKVYTLTPAGNTEFNQRLEASIAGVTGVVHHASEQAVNWTVNNVETPPQNSETPHPDAKFTMFTPSSDGVHLDSEHNAENLFTVDTAAACACSPVFTPCSPRVHSSEFTCSPLAPPLGGEGSEQEVNQQPDIRQYAIYEVMDIPPFYQLISWTCSEGERVEGTYPTFEASNGVLPLAERLASIPNGSYLNPIELLATHRRDPQRAVVDYCLKNDVKAISAVKAALRGIDTIPPFDDDAVL